MLANQLIKYGYDVKIMETSHIPIKNLKNPSFAILSSLKGILSRDKYDIVHAFNLPAAFAMRFAKGKKKVLSVHGVYGDQVKAIHSKTAGSMANFAESRALQWPDKLTTDSKATQAEYKKKLVLPICNYLKEVVKKRYPDKAVETLYQGISTSNWYKVEGMKLKHPCVGLLQGAVIWKKTKEMLTLTKVLEKHPDVMFYWVGDGPYREKILPMLNKYENFEWLGSLEYPNKVRKFLSEIDVYALISGIDMSPLTLLEAQLMEKPVVATDVGGIPELMKNNETGYLIKKESSDELNEKLLILLNDQEKRKRFGISGRNFVKDNFSWEKIAKDFMNTVNHSL